MNASANERSRGCSREEIEMLAELFESVVDASPDETLPMLAYRAWMRCEDRIVSLERLVEILAQILGFADETPPANQRGTSMLCARDAYNRHSTEIWP